MKRLIAALVLCAVPTASFAEPIGRWWSGYGQGTMEYGIKNDSAGSDEFYIACPSSGATINITVGGIDAPPNKDVIVTIGADEFELATDNNGDFATDSHVAYDNFRALWTAMRKGTVMRVRLSSGESTVFTLKGAATVLPREECTTSFAQ